MARQRAVRAASRSPEGDAQRTEHALEGARGVAQVAEVALDRVERAAWVWSTALIRICARLLVILGLGPLPAKL